MKFLNRFWPWSRIAALESQLDEERRKRQALEKAATNLNESLQKKDGHMRQLAKIIAIKGGFALFLLSAFSAHGQGTQRQQLTTNTLGLAPAPKRVVASTNATGIDWATDISIPGTVFANSLMVTSAINAEIINITDTATHLNTNIWPLAVGLWPFDASMWRVGDGATTGGISAGIRYFTSFTNPPLADPRAGELLVSQFGLPFSSQGSLNNPTIWAFGLRDNTNILPLIEVYAPDCYTNAAKVTGMTAAFARFGLDTNGLSISSGVGGERGYMTGPFRMVSGPGGDASGNSAVGGSGGATRALTFIGGHGGASTNSGNGVNVGTGGNGGVSGVFTANGGNGGASTNGGASVLGGTGGSGGTVNMNGGNGSTDGTSGTGFNGGGAGTITTSGGNAVADVANGGAGGAINTSGNSTNAGGSITTSATSTATPRKGGSITAYANTFIPATLFTTTSSAGPSASSSEVSLLGTAASFTGGSKIIGSNVVDHAGRTLRFKLSGTIATTATPTLEIRFKLGATTVIDTGAQTLSAITGTQTWTFSGEVTCRTTGSAGTWFGQGILEYFSTATAINGIATANTGTSTVSTIVDETIDCTAQFGANNTMTCTESIFELVN